MTSKQYKNAIHSMMDQFPPGTDVPQHIIVNGMCFHAGLIEYQQKQYLSMTEELKSHRSKIVDLENDALSLRSRINNMSFISRICFLFSGRLP